MASPDPAHPEQDQIRRLGSPAEGQRGEALALVYEHWRARSRGIARGRVLRFYSKASGARFDDLIEEGISQGWARLVKRVLTSPLALSEPVEQTFEAFLRRCIGSAIVDHLRREQTGSRVVPALKQLQAKLADPAQRAWVQEMIDRQRAGLLWNDVASLSHSTGIAEDVLDRFLVEHVEPALGRTRHHPTPTPLDALTRQGRRDLFERLMNRVDEIFGERTKGHLVASAMLRVVFTRPAVRGQATLDHEMLMLELEAMGTPWKSDRCRRPHAAGFPGAAQCKSCANALHQWRTRVTRRFREDPVFQELATVLREESPVREVGGVRRQGEELSSVSSDDDPEGDGSATGLSPWDGP